MAIHRDFDADKSAATVKAETDQRGCLACDNYRAVHPRTHVSYCTDGSKTVFADTGCASWSSAAATEQLRQRGRPSLRSG